jgi:hypothetical protein
LGRAYTLVNPEEQSMADDLKNRGARSLAYLQRAHQVHYWTKARGNQRAVRADFK